MYNEQNKWEQNDELRSWGGVQDKGFACWMTGLEKCCWIYITKENQTVLNINQNKSCTIFFHNLLLNSQEIYSCMHTLFKAFLFFFSFSLFSFSPLSFFFLPLQLFCFLVLLVSFNSYFLSGNTEYSFCNDDRREIDLATFPLSQLLGD